MPASPNDPRTKRRKAAGDDVNKMSMAPQPMPGLPQNQLGGNSMNNPVMDSPGPFKQMSQNIGSGPGQFTYGDMGLSKDDGRMGVVGFTERSGQNQNMVPGRGQNSMMPYNAPNASMNMEMMAQQEPIYMYAQADGLTEQNGLNNGLPLSYMPSPMGPMGQSPASIDPAKMPNETQYLMPDTIPLTAGVRSAEAGALDKPKGMGMSTGRGGGRNQTA